MNLYLKKIRFSTLYSIKRWIKSSDKIDFKTKMDGNCSAKTSLSSPYGGNVQCVYFSFNDIFLSFYICRGGGGGGYGLS